MRTPFSFLAVAAATTALAASDFERFDKQVGKYATQLGGDPKGLCLCRAGELVQSVGFLLRGSSEPIGATGLITSRVFCFVPGFDENTGVQGSTFVCEDFVPIAK